MEKTKRQFILKNLTGEKGQTGIIFVILFMAILVFSIMSPNFFSLDNFHSVLLTAVPIALIAIGECVCIMGGFFEMSVGMVASLSGLACASVVEMTGSASMAILTGIGVGILTGLISGTAVSRLGMNAFITTYALQEIYKGIIYIWSQGMAKSLIGPVYTNFTKWGQIRVAGIQLPIIVVVIIYIIAALFMKYTEYGRNIYLIGHNHKASRISGINVKNTRLSLFLICDVMAAIAGILVAMRTSQAAPFIGTTYCMEAIAATVLGGTSMLGGKGNMITTFIGVFTIYIIKNGLLMIGLDDFYQYIAIGVIIIFAIYIQLDHKKS